MTKKQDQSDNFGNLLSKLAKVPKAEVESEEAKWNAMRKRLKAKGESKGVRSRKQPPAAE